jgi:hypothetical protein
MPEKNSKKRPSAFISHASVNLNVARQVEEALDVAGFDSWLDYSDIHVGALLGKELLQALKASRAVVLIWSKAAAASRWVAAEVLSAFQLDRFIVPCVLSATELPQFLSRSVYLDLRRGRAGALKRLGEQVGRAPRARNEFPGLSSYWDKELEEAISRVKAQQDDVLDLLDQGDLSGAGKLHAKLDAEVRAAETRWRYDPTILNLAGYHYKNTYMLKHWDEYRAGRFPQDPVLQKGERRFFNTLFVNPIDYSALNGLGNLLLFQGDPHTAQFFVEKAIECAAKDGVDYQEAKNDLQVIRSRTRASEPSRVPIFDGRRRMKRSETEDH